MRKVITIADKETKLIEFETFESVQNNVDKGWINFLELGYFWAVVYPFLVVLSGVSGQEGLMPLELFEELIYSWVNDGNDIYDLVHDLVLNKNIPFCLDDSHVCVVVLVFIDDRVFGVGICLNFG